MEAVARALGPSLVKVQDAIHSLEKEKGRAAVGHGLLRLPDELLVLIFMATIDQGHYTYRPWKPAFRLSAVCRRFYAVAHSSPKMWSYVSTTRQEIVNICLERSRNAGLHVSITEDSPAFYSAARSHCSRWESIEIYLKREKYQTIVDKLLPDTALDAFPRLKRIVCAHKCGSAMSTRPLKKLVDHFYSSAPNLRLLVLTVWTSSRFTLPASLRCLELTVLPKRTWSPGSTRHLLSLLRTAPLLEEINLDLDHTQSFDPYPSRNAGGKQKIFAMPLVEKFSLKLRAHDGLQPLLHSLYFPNIKDLCIEVSDKEDAWDRDPDEVPPDDEIDNVLPGLRLVDAMFHRSKKYLQLTTLTLELDFWYHRPNVTLDKDLLMNYAKNCPALRDLTLLCSTPMAYLTLPPLRNLKLIWCHFQSTTWLMDYAEELRKDGAWSAFGTLEIERCSLEEGSWEVVSAGYGSKVHVTVWSDSDDESEW